MSKWPNVDGYNNRSLCSHEAQSSNKIQQLAIPVNI